ncbi:MAG: bifunctional ornithine acetyltransferase/N-acetylglutamate synthase, partial [Acidimicrobiales bacterium]
DARCEPRSLGLALSRAVDTTFNQMTLDGCTSTNDTVLVLAGGAGDVDPSQSDLTGALEEACGQLSAMMAADAEGGTKVARIVVTGAASVGDARRAARKVAESALVKCSLNGEDPYWGRVLSELGSSGAHVAMDHVEVSYGGVAVCRGGIAADHDAGAVSSHMKQQSIEISCDLGVGTETAEVLTCDLGHGYIDENRTTS